MPGGSEHHAELATNASVSAGPAQLRVARGMARRVAWPSVSVVRVPE